MTRPGVIAVIDLPVLVEVHNGTAIHLTSVYGVSSGLPETRSPNHPSQKLQLSLGVLFRYWHGLELVYNRSGARSYVCGKGCPGQ